MTEIEKYIEEFGQMAIAGDEEVRQWLRTTLTKVAEEAREERDKEIVEWAKSYDRECSDCRAAYFVEIRVLDNLITHLTQQPLEDNAQNEQ